jgi:putative ABC transport system ATP-binding protein
MSILIKISDLTKDYINEDVVTPVLHGVSFDIHSGEFVSIMGPSGSGKSTLMHILGFLDRPTSGVYEFEGKNTTGFTDEELATIRNERVGFVFQSFNLLARTSVLDNVKLPLVYGKKQNQEGLARKALESVGLGHRMDFFTNQISGGEKQRVAIARALVGDPAVIFADEPTGNLDSKSGNTVMQILQRLNDEGKTIILVTHEMDTAEHAKRLIKLKDGLLVEDAQIKNRTIAKAQGELVK